MTGSSMLTDLGTLSMLLLSAALFVLLARVVRRAGFSPWWVLLALVPLVNLVVLWVFAYTRWPALDADRSRS
jgi:hypothetical protein